MIIFFLSFLYSRKTSFEILLLIQHLGLYFEFRFFKNSIWLKIFDIYIRHLCSAVVTHNLFKLHPKGRFDKDSLTNMLCSLVHINISFSYYSLPFFLPLQLQFLLWTSKLHTLITGFSSFHSKFISHHRMPYMFPSQSF